MKKIYILTKTNDNGDILFVKAYLAKKDAQKTMRQDYKDTKSYVKAVGSTVTNKNLTANNAWVESDFLALTV